MWVVMPIQDINSHVLLFNIINNYTYILLPHINKFIYKYVGNIQWFIKLNYIYHRELFNTKQILYKYIDLSFF